MHIHHEWLRAKGWSEMEILHAKATLERADEKKHPAYLFLEIAVFWGLLFLILVGVLTVSIIIVPLLLLFPTSMIVLILAILGICFGALFAVIIPDIEWMENRHHALNVVILAVVGMANIWFIVERMNKLEAAMTIQNTHSPWLLGVVFAVALLAPYAFHLVESKIVHPR